MKQNSYQLQPIGKDGHREDSRYSDAAWKPLSRRQKVTLVCLARDAWECQKATGESFDDWRQAVAEEACGSRISAASQKDYLPLKSAFLAQAGNARESFRAEIRQIDNKRRVAIHKLQKALAAKNLPAAYAEKICQIQYKVPLAEATCPQIWRLFYTVQNRKTTTKS